MNQVGRAGSPVTVYFPDVLLSSNSTGNHVPELSPAMGEPSKSPIDQPSPALSFSRLPPEIRQLIWSFSFTPRILHINAREGQYAFVLSSAAHHWNGSAQMATACIYFTALDGFVESPHPFRVQQDALHRNQGLSYHNVKYWTLPQRKLPLPPGPVALYVCHESRTVALKHYELAFGGRNLQPDTDTEFAGVWKKSGLSEKRIWVNFEIDTIFLDPGCSYYWSSSNIPTLFICYAREEVMKIKRLAFSEKCIR